MLISTNQVLNIVNDNFNRENIKDIGIINVRELVNKFIILGNSQFDKPAIKIEREEKAVILYCNDDLFTLVEKYEKLNFKDMNFIDGIKIWKELKTIMEKKNEKAS